jgi:hypothetical protein
MMEALHSSETSILTRATLRNIPEDGILHSHRRDLTWTQIGWDRPPPTSVVWVRISPDAHNNRSITCSVGTILTMAVIYAVCRSDGLRWHDI